ncbi:type IV pilus modification protein PilV [Luteimonas sp. Y-2-2-4F]|nr:type IV pilus modification protein PilV [Luteimonas sp. Y-2-2-4F]MCD9030691.1 type IV pilus modification protein PilV [Luteimonas sp. Y-2-2-4F]
MKRIGRIRRAGRPGQGGFTLLEVLIALVVLAVGLLGLALMQTLNLRYTKSAEQRTRAVNLAGTVLDVMRSNRSQAAQYVVTRADFASVTAAGGCASDATLDAEANRARWMCEVREALGPGAEAAVSYNAGTGVASVVLEWPEEGMGDLLGPGEVELSTVL